MARTKQVKMRFGGVLRKFDKADDYMDFLIDALTAKPLVDEKTKKEVTDDNGNKCFTHGIAALSKPVEEYDVPDCLFWTRHQIKLRIKCHIKNVEYNEEMDSELAELAATDAELAGK